jgi:hypothetical protein
MYESPFVMPEHPACVKDRSFYITAISAGAATSVVVAIILVAIGSELDLHTGALTFPIEVLFAMTGFSFAWHRLQKRADHDFDLPLLRLAYYAVISTRYEVIHALRLMQHDERSAWCPDPGQRSDVHEWIIYFMWGRQILGGIWDAGAVETSTIAGDTESEESTFIACLQFLSVTVMRTSPTAGQVTCDDSIVLRSIDGRTFPIWPNAAAPR